MGSGGEAGGEEAEEAEDEDDEASEEDTLRFRSQLPLRRVNRKMPQRKP